MSKALFRSLLHLGETSYRPGYFGSIIGKCVRKLEGGTMYSSTWRRILMTHHRVQVGAMSYGECIDHAELPRGTVVGAYVSIASGVRVVRRNHPWWNMSTHPLFYADSLGWVEGSDVDDDELNPLIIGDDVWIGYNVIILRGCQSIGVGAVIGAGAVVASDIPAYSIACGNPATVKRFRFDEPTRENLLASKWWEMDERELRRIATNILRGDLEPPGQQS